MPVNGNLPSRSNRTAPMADHLDFAALYDELGVDADCTPAQFRQAYRRRVGQLHPDHAGNAEEMPRLQRLNRLYAAANEFQRLHGRLPGARHSDLRNASEYAAAPPCYTASTGTPPLSGSARSVRYLLPLAVAILALALWWTPVEQPRQANAPATRAPPVRGDSVLRLGADRARVKRIQGMPLNANANRWDYGPSWIEFDCGRVIDWYSSPSRPLRVDRHGPAMRGGELASSSKTLRCAH